jgi:signal transduction histidine kinase
MTVGRPEPIRTQLAAILDRWLPAASITPQQRAEFLSEIERVLETSKLEALGEFAAGAGHEINNPVATIAGRAQLLLGSEVDSERRHALEIIGGQALRIRDMIGDVMLFARPPEPRIERVELLPLVEQAVQSQAELHRKQSASIAVNIPSDWTLMGDRIQLLVLFSNLVRNSLEASDRPGLAISLDVRQAERETSQWSVITVADDGPGIPDEIREHLFDPFYSGRPAGRGLGFGLSKCWKIARLHGGEIQVLAAKGRGASFEVWWPNVTDRSPSMKRAE